MSGAGQPGGASEPHPTRRTWAAAVYGAVLVWALWLCRASGTASPGAVILLWLAGAFCARRAFDAPLRAQAGAAALCGLYALGFAFALTAILEVYRPVFHWNALFWLKTLLLALILFVFFWGAVQVLRPLGIEKAAPARVSHRFWWAAWGVMLLCWLPAFLTYGPVRLSPDSEYILKMALEGGLQDVHPILYTLVVRLFFSVFRAELAAYAFGFCQMALIAGCLSYSLWWLARRGCPVWFWAGALALFALCPMFPLQAIGMEKDGPFGAFLLVFCLWLYDAVDTRGAALALPWARVKLTAAALAVCFSRNTGFVILLVSTAAVLLCCAPARRRLALALLPALAFAWLVQGPLYGALGLSSARSEVYNIPLQQVARVLASGGALTEEQNATIATFMDPAAMAQDYNDCTTDNIKFGGWYDQEAFAQNVGPFLRVWAQLLPGHWRTYLDAWLMETRGDWHLGYAGGEYAFLYESGNGIFGIAYQDLIARFTGITQVRDTIGEFVTFWNPAQLVFFCMAAALLLLCKGQGRAALALLPIWLVWAVLMASTPTYFYFRYNLPFAFGLPFMAYIALRRPMAQKDL